MLDTSSFVFLFAHVLSMLDTHLLLFAHCLFCVRADCGGSGARVEEPRARCSAPGRRRVQPARRHQRYSSDRCRVFFVSPLSDVLNNFFGKSRNEPEWSQRNPFVVPGNQSLDILVCLFFNGS